MKTPIKKSIIPQIILSSLIAAVITAGIVSAATTIGNNINTDGTLSATGLTITGNASTTQMSVSSNLYLTALTANSIPYIGTSGLLTQDISNFIWDSTNNRLGIGTSSPYAKLSVVGETVSEYFTATSTTATSSMAGTFSIGSTTPDSTAMFSVGTSSPLLFVDKDSGYVGIGMAAPASVLNVNGPNTFLGGLSFGNDGTGIYKIAADKLAISFNGGSSDRYTIDKDYISSNVTGRWQLAQNNIGYTFKDDINTGVGRSAADSLTFHAGGERIRLTSTSVGIGTTTPTTVFQATTASADATTTIEFGKANQTRGTCLKMYDAAGVAVYCSVTGSGLSCSTTINCEN